jgi:hypothetical protein
VTDYDDDPREPTSQPLISVLRRGTMREVRVIRVTSSYNANISWTEYPNWTEPPASALLESVCGQFRNVCDTAVADFNDWIVTAKGQVWGALTGEFPKAISMLQITDLDEGKAFPPRILTTTPVRVIGRESLLRREDLSDFGEALSEGGSSFARLLLAEAKHYTWSNERFAPDRAIVVAAMACEVVIKIALRKGAADQANIVDLLLSNPRDWSLTAEGLWDKASLAVLDRSLRLDLPDVWKPLTALYSKRNGIVHRGETADMRVATRLVSAAESAFAWLGDVDD